MQHSRGEKMSSGPEKRIDRKEERILKVTKKFSCDTYPWFGPEKISSEETGPIGQLSYRSFLGQIFKDESPRTSCEPAASYKS